MGRPPGHGNWSLVNQANDLSSLSAIIGRGPHPRTLYTRSASLLQAPLKRLSQSHTPQLRSQTQRRPAKMGSQMSKSSRRQSGSLVDRRRSITMSRSGPHPLMTGRHYGSVSEDATRYYSRSSPRQSETYDNDRRTLI
jgi:hypothetical protein